MLSPVPGPTTIPSAVVPATSYGPRTSGTPSSRPNARVSRSTRYEPLDGAQYPVPDASPRSVTRRTPAVDPEPTICAVSQSWGRTTSWVRSARSGSCSANQRSFAMVMLASGTVPTASAQAWGPPSSPTSSEAAAEDRVSFHSNAFRTTS